MNPNENLPAKVNNSEVVKADEVVDPAAENIAQIVINCVRAESRSEKIALVNALDSADAKLADMVGQTINVKGIYAETHYSQKKQAPVCRVLILDDQGKSYATGSFIFMNSLKAILDVLGEPTEAEPLKIQIVEQAMEKGNALKAKAVE